jgi:hypothetical protein
LLHHLHVIGTRNLALRNNLGFRKSS